MRSAGRRACGRDGGVRRPPRRSAAALPAGRRWARVARASAVTVVTSSLGSLVAGPAASASATMAVYSSFGHISASQVVSCLHSARPGLRVTSSGCSAGMPIAARASAFLAADPARAAWGGHGWSPGSGIRRSRLRSAAAIWRRQAGRPQRRPRRAADAELTAAGRLLAGQAGSSQVGQSSSASHRLRACRAAIARCRLLGLVRAASCRRRLPCLAQPGALAGGGAAPDAGRDPAPGVGSGQRVLQALGADRAGGADPLGELRSARDARGTRRPGRPGRTAPARPTVRGWPRRWPGCAGPRAAAGS